MESTTRKSHQRKVYLHPDLLHDLGRGRHASCAPPFLILMVRASPPSSLCFSLLAAAVKNKSPFVSLFFASFHVEIIDPNLLAGQLRRSRAASAASDFTFSLKDQHGRSSFVTY